MPLTNDAPLERPSLKKTLYGLDENGKDEQYSIPEVLALFDPKTGIRSSFEFSNIQDSTINKQSEGYFFVNEEAINDFNDLDTLTINKVNRQGFDLSAFFENYLNQKSSNLVLRFFDPNDANANFYIRFDGVVADQDSYTFQNPRVASQGFYGTLKDNTVYVLDISPVSDVEAIIDLVTEAPTYIAPTASITNVSQTVEKGADLSLAINTTFTQNDAGALDAISLKQDGVEIGTNATELVNLSDIQANIQFQSDVSYLQGPVKNNNLGNPDPTGRIEAGTVSSSIRTITARLKIFYGSVSAIPTTSAQARALASVFENDNSISINTGTVNTNFVVALPSGITITQVIDTVNANNDITEEYELVDGDFTINDAGGNPVSYDLYAMTIAIPYSPSTIHQITLS